MSVAMSDGGRLHGRGHELLELWGAWNKDDGDGRASWSVKQRLDTVTDGHPPEVVTLIDKILAPIKLSDRLTYTCVDHFYRRDKAVWQVAMILGRSESWVTMTLDRVCGLVEREYADWKSQS